MSSAATVIPFPFAADTQAAPVQVAATMTHEAFVHAVRDIVALRVEDAATRQRLLDAKLVYGTGQLGARGICYFGAWQNGSAHDFVEIAALHEESVVQLAGTTIHELGHCLAGWEAGHGKDWKAAAGVLGLTTCEAAGQSYSPAHFAPEVWAAIEALAEPTDGTPNFKARPGSPKVPTKPRPCPHGIGTRGGRSRGKGSGSRMRLYHCSCPEGTPGRKIRTATDELDASCNRCGQKYERV